MHEEQDDFIPFQLEHVVAKQHGGADDLTNLAWACQYCNRYKGANLSAIDPVTQQLVRLYHPRTDAWDEHFERRGGFIVGTTAVGRATVQLLRMNEPARTKLRAEG